MCTIIGKFGLQMGNIHLILGQSIGKCRYLGLVKHARRFTAKKVL